MIKPKTFVVYPAPGKLIMDQAMMKRQIMSFVGRQFDKTLNGWKMADQPVHVAADNYHFKKIQEGSLLAADIFTAEYCQVPVHLFVPEEKLPEKNASSLEASSINFANKVTQ